MRDPRRIEPILALIKDIWINHPDLRLGQLIVGGIASNPTCPEVFYCEDIDLVEGLIKRERTD